MDARAFGRRGTFVKFRAVASNTIFIASVSGALCAGGCTGDTPAKDIGAPDFTKLALFYPVDNLVTGRGEAGAFADGNVSHVYVASHPIGTDGAFPVEEDGSFNFSILGVSGDVIEIAGARDDKGVSRGESVYIRVPRLPEGGSHYFCCPESLICVSDEEFELNDNKCPERNTLSTVCTSAVECRIRNNEILPIRLDDFLISEPDENGLVQVQGKTPTPSALIRMENRGLRAIGGHNPGTVRSVISDSFGNFRMKNIPARGDDELVFQAHDLLGYRSPEAPILVPDAKLKGVDVLGAYAFGRLVAGSEGYVVVRVHPHGVDGRGICPNSTTGPTLCFTGGLTRQMVSVDTALLEKTEALVLEEPEAPYPAGISESIATEGDPLTATQRIVLVMDISEDASKIDTDPPARFDAAWRFVRSLRKRDRLAIVTFGGGGTENVVRAVNFTEIGPNLEFFQSFLTEQMPGMRGTGASELLQGVSLAADMLGSDGGRSPGTIVGITMTDQIGDNPESGPAQDLDSSEIFDEVYEKLIGEKGAIYRLYVVGAQIPATYAVDPNNPQVTTPSNFNIYVKSLADFSRGRAVNMPLVPLINEPLDKLAGEIGGSYAILYKTKLPCTGKDPDLDLTVTVNLPSGSQTGTYKGSLTVDAADDPRVCP